MKSELDQLVEVLRAAGEPSRLRILGLLRHGDLAVGELVDILGQSQPGISQHLKTLSAAGLVERLPEGSWVFYRASTEARARAIVDGLFAHIDFKSADLVRDLERLDAIRAARAESADSYFERNAADWDTIRALHYPNDEIEKAILVAAGDGPFERLVDIGTGTGRMLSLLGPLVGDAEGVDRSHEMLTIARANLARDGVLNARVRQGDASALPHDDSSADLVVIHQVLHYIDHPERVVAEAARILRPGGRLLVVDFAPHDLEFLRIDHAHRHLGLSPDAVADWAKSNGLSLGDRRQFDPPQDAAAAGLSVQILVADKIAEAEAKSRNREAVA